MSLQIVGKLPNEKKPYFIRNGEGERFLFGTQVASIVATTASTGDKMEIVQISGGKGDYFPAHVHEKAHEGIVVLDGRLEVELNGQVHLLTAGDYVHIPAGTVHAYWLQSHRTRFWSFTMNGNLAKLYSIIGEPFDKFERPPVSQNPLVAESFSELPDDIDIKLVPRQQTNGLPQLVKGCTIPDLVQPYVLESGEGIHLLSGDTVHSLLTTKEAAAGQFLALVSEGPKGLPIGEHAHEYTNETFMCLQGQMTLWVDGEELHLLPGDFAYVPAKIPHRFRCDAHYTKFLGVLTPGQFEDFFRILGDPYEYPIFPSEPAAYRFDRVIQRIEELDLILLGKPPVPPAAVEEVNQ
ncbi:quercetin 2,3-dioxygenase [Neobacillus sp. 3P2-tot-E-2]|uniref:quercetin 2,3-dioxygenase n=1 Tax=Neobacillus sp. 3P2-tot-E-2 TaxID=3132212 RepID=UPI0039A1D146